MLSKQAGHNSFLFLNYHFGFHTAAEYDSDVFFVSHINSFILCSISNSSKNEHLRFENEKKAVKQVYLCNEYVQCR